MSGVESFGKAGGSGIPDIWITSDTHFYHKNIIEFCPETRPFVDVEEMNETLIYRWNLLVKPGDLVYHCGDFGFAKWSMLEGILSRLNGNKYLVYGNHDYELRRAEAAKYFVWRKEYAEIKVDGHKVCLFHFPIHEWNGAHRGSIHFHGHLHSKRVYGRSMDVGCESNDCLPWNMRTLIAKFKEVPVECEYH